MKIITSLVSYLVVARNSNINMTQRRVGVTQGNDGDVHIGSLSYRLVIYSWVSNQQETGLTEGCLDLVSEGTWGETSSNWGSSGVMSKLQDGTLYRNDKIKSLER